MITFGKYLATGLTGAFAIIAVSAGVPAEAQSAGSYTSGSSYNPVQQAINRNSMNAAIIRQATGSRHRAASRRSVQKTREHR